MGTRSLIVLHENTEGNDYFLVTYCHWDGYFEGVGETIYTYWNNEKKARKLTRKTSMSSCKETEKKLNKQWHRDAKKNTDKLTLDQLCAGLKETWSEYLYVFDVAEGRWWATSINHQKTYEEQNWYPLDVVVGEDVETKMEHYRTMKARKEKLSQLCSVT